MTHERDDLPEATVRRSRSGRAPTGRRTLQVLGEGFHASYPLAATGRLTIGRSSENLVPIDDPEISRHHLVLHVADTLSLEDLGSSNGSWVGDRKLEPRSVTTLLPGDPIRIGSTTLMVLERAIDAGTRRLWNYDYLEARIDEECRRCVRHPGTFALLHIVCQPKSAAPVVERRLLALLPDLDVVARYVPGEYQVMLIGADEAQADTVVKRLVAGLADDRVRVKVAAAAFPIDGTTCDELVTRAATRATDGELDEDDNPAGPVIADASTRELYRLAERIAPSRIHVLITGETGAGKEVLAEEIHRRSGRADHPMRRVDCVTLPADRAAEVLFGVEGGGEGALGASSGGTVLLDEVCALPLDVQGRLVGFLGGASQSGDVRIVALTNRDIEAEIAAGTFREDLYFRLDGITLTVPPLRRRPAEIEPLCERFVAEAARFAGRAEAPMLGRDALTLLFGYPWPGNVRELRNTIRRAVLLCDGDEITPAHLPAEKLTATFASPSQEGSLPPAEPLPPLREVREHFQEAERQRIIEALERVNGNQTEAAKLLGIARRTLIKRLDAYALPRPRKKT